MEYHYQAATQAKPIYDTITSQIKALIMSGELKDRVIRFHSLRALVSKSSACECPFRVQKAYEDLQRGPVFIETTIGRGSFVAAQNKDFFSGRAEQAPG